MTNPETPEGPVAGGSSDASAFGADRLLECALPGRDMRLLVADVSASAFEAEYRHLSGRLASETLARAAAAAVLLGADLKGEERLAVQIRTDGPLQGLLAEVDAELHFRGYTNKKVLAGLDLGVVAQPTALAGDGRVQLVRSTGAQVVYKGITNLRTGDIASDLEAALEESSQIPSRLFLDHGYDRQLTFSAGALLQALPGCSRAEFDALGAAVAARAAGARPFGRDPEALARALLGPDVPFRPLASRSVKFACRCSRQKVVDMLKQLGPPEDGEYPEESRVTCAFCNDLFTVPRAELS
jgi:molecular chaperone Hsp33